MMRTYSFGDLGVRQGFGNHFPFTRPESPDSRRARPGDPAGPRDTFPSFESTRGRRQLDLLEQRPAPVGEFGEGSPEIMRRQCWKTHLPPQ